VVRKEELWSKKRGEPSSKIRERVNKARAKIVSSKKS